MTARQHIDEAEAHFTRCMAVWVDWMHSRDSHRLGLPSRDSVSGHSLTNYMAGEDDSAIVYDLQDAKTAQTVEACMQSLMPAERHAIMMAYGFSRVWPFRTLDREETLGLGMITLRRLIAKRC